MAAVLFAVAITPDVAAMPLVRLSQPAHRTSTALPATSDYLKAAVMGNLFEINAAKVAQAKSRNSEVGSFAATMIKNHNATSDALAAILKQTSFDFAPPSTLDNEHAAMVDQLSALADGSFDRGYIQQEIASHEAALRVQIDYAKGGRDQLLRKFAAETAPKIRADLILARQIYSRLTRIASRAH